MSTALLPLLSLLACSPPQTRVLLVQGQPVPEGARALGGAASAIDAWRTAITGVASQGESWPTVLPASMDRDFRIQAAMRSPSSFSEAPFWSDHPSAAVLFVPTTWPLQEMGEGVKLLAPVPDLKGTAGTPTWYGPKFAAKDGLSTVGLFQEGDSYLGRISGPQVPGTGTPKRDLNFLVDRGQRAAVFTLDEQELRVAEGTPATWARVSFGLGDHHRAHGWVRFHTLEAFNHLEVVMSALHQDAGQAWTAMSWPADFGGALATRHGPFATALAPYPVAAVGSEGLSCEAFAAELLTLSGERAAIAAQREERLVLLGSVAPQAWADSGCPGDAGWQSVEQGLDALQEQAGWRDRVVVVGVSPAWVMGAEIAELSELAGALQD